MLSVFVFSLTPSFDSFYSFNFSFYLSHMSFLTLTPCLQSFFLLYFFISLFHYFFLYLSHAICSVIFHSFSVFLFNSLSSAILSFPTTSCFVYFRLSYYIWYERFLISLFYIIVLFDWNNISGCCINVFDQLRIFSDWSVYWADLCAFSAKSTMSCGWK